MLKHIVVLAASILMATTVSAQNLLIETSNQSLSFALYDDGGILLVQKGTGTVWRSRRPEKVHLTVTHTSLSPTPRWMIHWDNKDWQIQADLVEDGIVFTMTGPEDRPMGNDIPYPFAFMPPDGDWEMVIPTSEGMIFNITDAASPNVLGAYECWGWAGLAMPWFGVTNFKGGMVGLFETPDDASLDLQIRGNGRENVWHPQPVWRPSKHMARYPRVLRYRFFNSGDYVEMAKWYRRWLIDTGEFTTLREKSQRTPAVKKMIGALDLHLRGDAQSQLDAISWLRDQGVKKMLINTTADRSATDRFKEWGYLLGLYTIYTDMIGPDSTGTQADDIPRSDGFPDDAYQHENGQMHQGFFGYTASLVAYRCAAQQLPLMKRLVPDVIASHDYEAYFIDVTTADRLRECYSWNHPLTRGGDREARSACLQYIMDQGMVTGSEDVDGFAAPHLHYFEGLVTQVRFNNTPHYFANDVRARFYPSANYRDYSLNERPRIPLWELVYHDAVVSTWRWNITPDRYTDPTWWIQNDLILAVNGSMPIYVVSKETLMEPERGRGILRTYKWLCPLNETIGWEEMVDHNYLTPDRQVQESRYADGTAVVVNFSDRAFSGPQGVNVPAKNISTYRWK